MRTESLPLAALGYAPVFVDLAGAHDASRALLPGGMALAQQLTRAGRPGIAAGLGQGLVDWATELGAAEASRRNASRLRDGALAVVTGQQPGLLGGPLLSLLKAATTVRAAADLEQATGRAVVPVFWIEGDDHDLHEINRATVAGDQGDLVRVEVAGLGAGGSVGSMPLGDGAAAVLAELERAFGGASNGTETLALVRRVLGPGATFTSAFAGILLDLLGARGLVVCDGAMAAVKQASLPLVEQALRRADEAMQALAHGEAAVAAAGFAVQAPLAAGTMPLFVTEAASRRRLGRRERDDGLELLKRDPGALSPGVHLRPLVQDFVLPTIATVLGPAEASYQAQLGGLYELLAVPRPAALPRACMTLIEPRVRRMLDTYGLGFGDVRGDAPGLARRLATARSPVDLVRLGSEATDSVSATFDKLAAELSRLDASLARSAEGHRGKAISAVDGLMRKAESAARRADEVARRHAVTLGAALAPAGELQERVLSPLHFLARVGSVYVDRVVAHGGPSQGVHLLVDLGE